MDTINEKLAYMYQTKKLIKDAIIEKGVNVSDSDTFRSYADKISNIQSGSTEPKIFGVGNSNISSVNNNLFINGICEFETITKEMLEITDSSTLICVLGSSAYTKTNTGLAIGGYGTPYGSNTSGPILVSTTPENSYYGGGDVQSFTYDGDGNIYYYYQYGFINASNITSTSGVGVRLNKIADIYKSMINGRTIYESLLDYYYKLS